MGYVHSNIIEHSRDISTDVLLPPSNNQVAHAILHVAVQSFYKFESKPVCVCIHTDENTPYILLHSGHIVKRDALVVGFVQGMTCAVLLVMIVNIIV